MKAASANPFVLVLIPGFIVREGNRVADASSTITLVESQQHRLIVDTGSPRDRPKLERALRSLRIGPESVEYVVNTHLHIDHSGCNDMFENARQVAHALEEPPLGALKVRDSTALVPGVELVPTPGHTAGSLSVIVAAERRYAIVGDAIPTKGNYDQHIPPSINIDRALALKSMDYILGRAEVIVPGHGPPFEVLGKEYDG